MGLKEQLKNDYKEAMKNADKVRKDTVNMVRAAIKQQEIDTREELNDDADIVRIIKKQVKMRTDALADFAKGGRDDIVESYTKEIEILKTYLPEEMTNEAIVEKVKETAEKLGISEGMKNMGVLMKNVMAEIKDAADGSTVNKIVKAYLNGDFDEKEDKE
ncbi:MAG TPA: GatB/YqeY domain-containing protein [Mogibacterium sp.]|nr:GatB/YqeY domain-containing protein [Mogibacterium sp.]